MDKCSSNMRFYIDQIPEVLKSFVTDIIDVQSDGNCGFRCIAVALEMGESCWPQIRRDLQEELYENQTLYEQVLIQHGRCNDLLKQLQHEGDDFAPTDKWMTMPDMGYIIATKYNVVVFSLSSRLSLTIPPLKGQVPPPVQRFEIAVAFVNDGHFVLVRL